MRNPQIRIWVKDPGCNPVEMTIANNLRNLQQIVGGYIECWNVNPYLIIICNEEGKLQQLPYNCTIDGEHFVGSIIFAGINGENFDDCPCNEDALRRLLPQLWEE